LVRQCTVSRSCCMKGLAAAMQVYDKAKWAAFARAKELTVGASHQGTYVYRSLCSDDCHQKQGCKQHHHHQLRLHTHHDSVFQRSARAGNWQQKGQFLCLFLCTVTSPCWLPLSLHRCEPGLCG
jgi:hypothetical protein